MKCILCEKEIHEYGILVNADGDFVCSQECFDKREKIMAHFFEHILTDDKKFAEWLGVPEEWVWTL